MRRRPNGWTRPRPPRAERDELRAEGNTAEADRFDELAKIALRRQVSFEGTATSLETQVAAQTELADKLKDGLNKLRAKREDLVNKRDELVSRAKMAQAQSQVQESLQSVSVMDPTSEISRFEERIRRQEAQVRGREEVAASSLDEQFASLESRRGRRGGRGAARRAQVGRLNPERIPAMQQMYHPSDLAAMDPLVLMKNLDHVRMTSRRLSYILQQQVHLYTPEANELREQIDRYVEAERQIEGEMARRTIRA